MKILVISDNHGYVDEGILHHAAWADEVLYSNKPEKFINNLFPELPRHDETGEREII